MKKEPKTIIKNPDALGVEKVREMLANDYAENPALLAESELRDDKEFVLCLIEKNPVAYAYASRRLQLDKEVLAAANKSMDEREELKNDHEDV